MPKVSIIIPVYNVEKYLPECIASIIAQDFPDFECLLIDDGSTDGSGALCDNYAVKDSRFRVFHQENQGVSAARNRGIAESTGEWIYFIDGDDWMMPGIFNGLSLSCDMIVGRYRREGVGVKYELQNRVKICKNFALSYLFEDIRTHQGAYILKKEVLDKNKIAFPIQYKYGEDMEFILKSLLCSTSIVIDDRCWMAYRINPKSAMSKLTLRRYDVFFSRLGLIDYAKKCGNWAVVERLRNFSLAESLFVTTKALIEGGMPYREIVGFIKDTPNVRNELIRISVDDKVNKNFKLSLIELLNHPKRFYLKQCLRYRYSCLRQKIGELKLELIKKQFIC